MVGAVGLGHVRPPPGNQPATRRAFSFLEGRATARPTRTDPQLQNPQAIERAAHEALYPETRYCHSCGARLSIYNPNEDECQPCEKARLRDERDTTSNRENW